MFPAYHSIHSFFHASKLTLAGIDEEAFARSLISSRVEMNPHQVNAALFALKSPLSKGVLLADEVGLGKTIEAGLVISQKWAEHKRRILLIVPASLRKQWELELFEKFSLPSTILESATYKAMVKEGHQRPFEAASVIVIASYEFAARRADELKLAQWDLVIFDEAHRLRNVYKKNGSQRAKDLRDALVDPFKILLTATPLQNSLMELYGIISIIDDQHFGGESAFKAQYIGSAASNASLDVLRDRLTPISHRTLRRQVQEAGHINFRKRHAKTFDFEPSHLEVDLYERLSAFLKRKDTIAYGERANQLVVLQIRKILGSSTFAVSQYLSTLIERLKHKKTAAIGMTDDVEDFAVGFEEEDSLEEDETIDLIDIEKLEAEIQEISDIQILANSIGDNAKGQKLLSQLPEVLEEIESKGGKRKAVIFTESVRTQKYLAELLSLNGYSGQIVLMNGSNSDQESKSLYTQWKERHAGTEKISGSKSADMKAAIVEAFKSDEKTILIATESGAEGINLQFCSLLINYDLPWNPQRVEQRIGRCHRYGQLIDVTVVNMLNMKNKTEARIYELLSEKFHLFDGVFGASDEVLGSLISGLDFEKEVLRIVQECRTEEEAEREFDQLKASIQDSIDEDMLSTRKQALESLDADVISKLHSRGDALANILPEFRQRLLMIAKAELPQARFHSEASERFDFNGKTYTTEWPVADEKDWQFFRVNDGLGEELIEQAKNKDQADGMVHLEFHPNDYPYTGQLGAVKELSGQSGWMRIVKAVMPTPKALREEILIACRLDAGLKINSDVADKMFMCPAVEKSSNDVPNEQLLEELMETEFNLFSDRVKKENFEWIEAEDERLSRYADDVEIELDAQIGTKEVEIKELQKERRSPDLSMEEKLSLSRKIKNMEADLDDMKLSKFEQRKKIRREVSDKLDEFADSLNLQPKIEPMFTLRWSVAG